MNDNPYTPRPIGGLKLPHLASLLRRADARIEALEAKVERLGKEMLRYLPVLEALEANPSAWEWYTDGTGIATLNGYRATLEEE